MRNDLNLSNNNTEQIEHVIPQEAFDWYDEYAHGVIDRRCFMERLSSIALGSLTMAVLTSALMPSYAKAEQISFNDENITASYETYDSPQGHKKCRGYLVQPKLLREIAPVVLVIHENRGLNPYIKDVARRLAKDGFIAFAPDGLHPLGGYPGNDDQGRSMQAQLDKKKLEQDFIAGAKFIKSHKLSNGKLGAVGFCYGGYIVNMLAATIPDQLDAGVPFYGTPAVKELREDIKGPLLLQYGELDTRVNASIDEYEVDLRAVKAKYEKHVYKGANHGFHNDSTGRYEKEDAELAWKRTIEFFKSNL